MDDKEGRDRSGPGEPSDHGAGPPRERGEGATHPLAACRLCNEREVALAGSLQGGTASEEPKGQSWRSRAAVLLATPSLNLNGTPLWPACHATE